jgi:hypothetical protein
VVTEDYKKSQGAEWSQKGATRSNSRMHAFSHRGLQSQGFCRLNESNNLFKLNCNSSISCLLNCKRVGAECSTPGHYKA